MTRPLAAIVCLALAPLAQAQPGKGGFADKPTADQIAFFEKKIRPVLVDNCYKCHSADAEKVKGGLTLDTRDGTRKGGETGAGDRRPAAPRRACSSRRSSTRTRTPRCRRRASSPDGVIADFEAWVKMGAPDPRDGKAAARQKYEVDMEKGREFWAFQPPKKTPAPAVKDAAWREVAHRPLPPRGAGSEGADAGRRRGQADPHPPRPLRPDRPAADARRGGSVRRGHVAGRVREGGRPAAGVAAVRRAVGPALARRRPVRREHRQDGELQLPARLAVPRLRHRRVQRRQAVRPVRQGATRRRPDADRTTRR